MENTINAIFEVGEKMKTALSADNLEDFYLLMDEREKLVQQLPDQEKNYKLPTETSQALEDQFQAIVTLLNQKEQNMMSQLQHVDRIKKANKSYKGTRKRRELINRTLLG